ncbi:MAG: ATP-binding protein [Nitrospirae bacterium]|nr:ATP-binding protein [Nitrospirota bacterium]
MNLKLKSVKVEDILSHNIDFKINNLEIEHPFSLLIGDNAQGKTRFIRFLMYIASLTGNSPRIIGTNCKATFTFKIENDDNNLLTYEIDITNENGKNTYKENITKNNKPIYSSSDKMLINEKTGNFVGPIFISSHTPVISTIDNSPDYSSISSINSFFSRIVCISSEKRNEIQLEPNQIRPNENGTNISNVLLTWKNQYPHLFNETILEFKRCFDFIDDINFSHLIINNLNAEIIFEKEKEISKQINLNEWSNGMYRILHLLMLPNIPFKNNDETLKPSLIIVDEIENGLDYKRLEFIIEFLKNYSDDMQIIIASHSPLVCDFIHPKNWIVIKRKGSTLHFNSPSKIEENLEEDLELFKRNHWDFYSRHINNSDDYNVDENNE